MRTAGGGQNFFGPLSGPLVSTRWNCRSVACSRPPQADTIEDPDPNITDVTGDDFEPDSLADDEAAAAVVQAAFTASAQANDFPWAYAVPVVA